MKRTHISLAAAGVVLVAVCLLALRYCYQSSSEMSGPGNASPSPQSKGWKGTGLPDPAKATEQEIADRWPPDGEWHGRYRRLVRGLADQPPEVRLEWYARFAPRLSIGAKGGQLQDLAQELAQQKEFEVIESLVGLLEGRTRKRALCLYLSGVVSMDLWKDSHSERGVKGLKLLKKLAMAHPDWTELMPYHPDGLDLLSHVLGNRALEGLFRWEAAHTMRTMVAVGAVSAEGVIQALEAFVDDPTEVNDSNPTPTLGGRVRECIEAIRLSSKRGMMFRGTGSD